MYGENVTNGTLTSPAVNSVISWKELMDRIEKLSFYNEHHETGNYNPDALIGITNGGLIIAEIISKLYFRKIPLIALWANRWNLGDIDIKENPYFSNAFAKAALDPLKQIQKKKKTPISVLVIDDDICSGNTCRHAIRFIKDELGDETEVIFQPIVTRNPEYIQSAKGIFAPEFFKVTIEQLIETLFTKKAKLPYNKDIRS